MNLYLVLISIVLMQSIVNGRYFNNDFFTNFGGFNHQYYTSWKIDNDGTVKYHENLVPDYSSWGSNSNTNTNQAGSIDCQNQGGWPDNWIQFENEVLTLVNQVRARGTSCGGRWRSPVSSLSLNSKLTRSARCHAVDMVQNNYFNHVNQQGVNMGGRVRQAGYRYSAVGENIAHGQRSPQQVVNVWKNSPSHCNNMMDHYKEIGIGYVGENSHMWVQNFGTSY